jgi:pyridoxamine 5'-phosphate oxidase
LRFHTDLRSQKIGQISSNQNASVLIYDASAKLQIRLTGKILPGPVDAAEAAWDASTEFARRCYMTQSAPGNPTDTPTSGLPSWIEGKQPTLEMLKDARENFAILIFTFDRIDWLYLANKGHRRANYTLDPANKTWKGSWLIP